MKTTTGITINTFIILMTLIMVFVVVLLTRGHIKDLNADIVDLEQRVEQLEQSDVRG